MGPSLPERNPRPFLRAALLLTALLFARPAAAADKIWKYGGVDSLAATATNWVGGVAPTAGDHVIFGSTTPTAACNWNLAVTVSSVEFSGAFSSTVYLTSNLLVSSSVVSAGTASGTIDLNGKKLSIGANLIADGLTFTSSVAGSSVVFEGAAAGVASKSAGPLHFETFISSKAVGSTVTVTANMVVDSSFTVSEGALILSGVRLDLAGAFYLGGYLGMQTSTIALTGTTPQALAGGPGSGGGPGGMTTSLAALYVQNPSTTTLPGLVIGVVVATKPASTLSFVPGDTFSIGTLTVSGGNTATRVLLISTFTGSQTFLNAASASVDYAYVRDINASGGIAPLATHAIDGGNNVNWTITIGGGNLVWSGAGGNALASNGANWIGGAAPSTDDFVTFGSTGPALPCTWDIAVQVASFSVVGSYASAITLSSDLSARLGVRLAANGASLILAGRAIHDQGDWSAGSANVTGVAGSSVSFEGAGPATLSSLTGGVLVLPGLSIAKTGSAIVTAQAGLNVGRDFEVKTGTFAAGAFREEVGGSLRALGGYLDVRAATIAFSGAGAQSATLAGAGRASRAAALYAQSPATTTFGAWATDLFVATRPAAGVVFATGVSTMTIGALQANGQALGTRVMLSGPGLLKVTGSSDVQFATVSGLDASAGLTIPALFSLDGGGNANWSISALGGALRQWSYTGLPAKASNAANWSGGIAPSTGDFVLFGGLTPNSPCTWDLPMQFSSFSVSGAFASVVTLSTNLSVANGVRLDAAGGTLDPSGLTILDGGDWTARAGALSGGVAASSVVFQGGVNATLAVSGAGPAGFGNVIFMKASTASVALGSDLSLSGAFDMEGGSVAAGGHRLELAGDIRINGGALDVSRATFVFAGAAPQQTVGSGGGSITSIAGVFMQNPTTTTIVDIAADVFVATRPASAVVFTAPGGSTATFGSFTVSGQGVGTRVRLLGGSPGIPIKVTGTAAIDFASVQNLNASPGITLVAPHSIDAGGNTNWTISSVGGAQAIWRYAGGGALASIAANWAGGVAPSAGDFVLFGASTPASSCTWDLPVAIDSFSVSDAYAGTVMLSTDMFVTGAGVRLDAPAATFNFAGKGVRLTGDWNAGATAVATSVQGGSVTFYGGGDSHVASLVAGPANFAGFVSSKAAGGRVLPQADLQIGGDFVILSGTFSAPSRVLYLRGDLVSNGGYMDVARTTAAFAGTGPQTLTGNGAGSASSFAGLDIQNASTVTIPDVAADVLVATRPNATVLLASQLSPLTLGALQVNGGSSGSLVSLKSSQPGVPARLAVISTAAVNFAQVTDVNASYGIPLIAYDSVNGLGNSSWTFLVGSLSIQTAQFQSAFISSAAVSWSSNFGAGKVYTADVSTDSFATLVQSSVTQNLSASFAGLTPNTTYYGRVSTAAGGAYTAAGSTVTLAAVATGPAVAAVYLSSVAMTWGTAGNPAGTHFVAGASTDAFATVSVSSDVLAAGATISGLLSNATYTLAVQALNRMGVPSPLSAFVTTVTAVAAPALGASPSATASSILESWSSGGNDAGTLYEIRSTTNVFPAYNASTQTASLSFNFTGLAANTTYAFEVRAIGRGGATTPFLLLGTTQTLLLAPGAAGAPFPGVGVSSVAAAWTSGGNGAGTSYTADLSTDSFATLAFSSTTLNASALFGTGGAGGALTPNTTYFVRVKAQAGANFSGYLQVGSTSTLPAAPAAPIAADVQTASGTWSWGAGGNSAATTFLTQLSTDSFATFVQTGSGAGTQAVFNGLTANTTYQFRVAALGFDGYQAGPVAAASSCTLPSAPSPGAFSLFISSAHLAWTDADPPAVRFSAEASSDSFATLTAASATANAFADLTALTPNTTYFLRVRAIGNAGAVAGAAAGTAVTATYPPAAPAFTASSTGSAVASWSANGNPGGVMYGAEISTDSFATLVQSSATAAAGAAFGGLAADTTHQLRVRSLNRVGTASAYVLGAATTTAVAAPAAAPLSGVAVNDVIANWGAGGNGPGTLYEAQVTTNVFPTFNASTRTTALSFDFAGLAVNTTYAFQVRAIGRDGTLTAFVALGTTQTLLLTPGAPAQPILSVGVSSAAVSWTNGGNGPGVVYQADVSTDNFASVNVTSATQSLSALFGTGGCGPALASDATHYFRVRATGGASGSAYVSLGSTATFAAAPSALASVTGTTTTLTLTWSASGNAATTVYQAQASTNSFATVLATAQAAGVSAAFSGLLSNATHQLRVRALGLEGPTAFVSLSTWTVPAAPGSPSASAVSATSVTVTWTAPNAAGSPYQAALSTQPPLVYLTTTAYGGSASFTGLLANVTYYASVAAFAPDGTGPGSVAAAATATPVAAPLGFANAGLGVATGTWTWSIGLNGPTTYQIDVATTPGFAPLQQTVLPFASSAAGAGYAFSGLQPNTTQYLRLRALGITGSSAFLPAAAIATDPAPPASLPLVSVGTGAVFAAWSAGGNPPGTIYEAQDSTDAFASVNSSSITALTQAGFGGLAANTSHGLRVRVLGVARNGAFVALPSTWTLPGIPGVPVQPFTAVGLSSVAVAWTAGGNTAGTLYQADASTDSFLTLVVSSLTANLTAAFGTGGAGTLTPDRTYQFRVAATSGSSLSPATVLGSTATAAADPSAPAATASSTGTLTLAWSANGNPADTQYLAQASTDAFATVSQSSAVKTTTAILPALVPDTTYALRVRAVGRGGAPNNAYVAAATTATLASAPAAPAGAFGSTTATLAWSAAGNPAASTYEAQISTDAFASLSLVNVAPGTTASFSGLIPNTTYHLRVRTLGFDGATAFAVAAASATMPAVPAAPSSARLGVAAASMTWSANGNPAGTPYGAELSTDSFATLVQTSVTVNLFATYAGLQANATYYQRVRAAGMAGALSAYAVAAPTVTAVAPPTASGPALIATGTITAAWGAGGNAAGTLYDAQISTDVFASVNSSLRAAALSAVFGGLTSNTSYDFRVRAVGRDGTATAFTALPSTTTLLLPPGAAATPFPGVGASSLTAAWSSGGNGPGTMYRAQISTNGFATIATSSDTANLSALFGAGGAGAPLPVNAACAARVLAFNGSSASGFVLLGSTSTLALAPSGTAVVAVTSQTVRLDWPAGGNPEPGTSYQVDGDATSAFGATTTTTVSTSAAVIANLAMSSTYYFRVRALSAAGAPTGYDATVSAVTLPPAPTQPGAPAAAALGVSSLTWTWSGSTFVATYDLYGDTAASVLLNVQSSAAFVQTGLGPNASSFLTVVGVNVSGPGPRSVPGLGWTLANPPAGTAASIVRAESATLAWGLNGNPAYTASEVQRSLDGTVYASVASGVAGASYADSGLQGCTTYYYRVRNLNGSGLPTSFDSPVGFATLVSTPLAPTALSARPQAGLRVALAWSPSPSTDIAGYRLYSDAGAGTVNFASPYASFASTETAFVTPPLVSSAAYVFVLRATNRCGNEEKNVTTRAASPAVAAPAAVTAAVDSPQGGRHVNGNRVTVSASQASGALSAVSSIRFQYRVSGAGAWADAASALPAHPNPALAAPFYTQWDVTALAPGAYDLRAVAYDLSLSSDPAPAATTIVVDPAAPDLVENDAGGGRTRKDQTVYASIDNTVIAGGPGLGDPLARLVLPAGALANSTATLSLVSDPDVTGISTAAADARSVGLFGRVDLSNAQTTLSGGRAAALTLSYPDENNDGIVDGQAASASNLRFYSYDAVAGAWRQDLATTFDPAARTVTGSTPHFSLFGVFAQAASASTLDAVRAYPVPYKPNGPNPDEGRPYAAGAPNTGVVFDGLPAGARIQIYTADGRLVVELANNGAAAVQWDAKNGKGRDVATGGYFAVVSSPGLRSVVRRLSIIR